MSLAELPGTPDVVDVFPPAGRTAYVAEEVVAVGASALWIQLGLHADDAVRIAYEAGPGRRHQPLPQDRARPLRRMGLHLAGFDTGVISSRRTRG